jgi:hypothetical protein
MRFDLPWGQPDLGSLLRKETLIRRDFRRRNLALCDPSRSEKELKGLSFLNIQIVKPSRRRRVSIQSEIIDPIHLSDVIGPFKLKANRSF